MSIAKYLIACDMLIVRSQPRCAVIDRPGKVNATAFPVTSRECVTPDRVRELPRRLPPEPAQRTHSRVPDSTTGRSRTSVARIRST